MYAMRHYVSRDESKKLQYLLLKNNTRVIVSTELLWIMYCEARGVILR